MDLLSTSILAVTAFLQHMAGKSFGTSGRYSDVAPSGCRLNASTSAPSASCAINAPTDLKKLLAHVEALSDKMDKHIVNNTPGALEQAEPYLVAGIAMVCILHFVNG